MQQIETSLQIAGTMHAYKSGTQYKRRRANWNLRNPCETEEFFEKCEIIWKLRNNLENAKTFE